MLNDDFLLDFKRRTEDYWRQTPINPTLYGFQFQQGTRWNRGLSEEEVGEYEKVLGVRFPDDFEKLLKLMNGTDLPTLNVYGYSGEPPRQSVGVFSYPRDLGEVERRIKDVEVYRDQLITIMAEQGFELAPEDSLVPIYVHRYVVCASDSVSSAVLSITDGMDAIVYGNSLREYLEREFLRPSMFTTSGNAHPAAPSPR
jgi:hypothetical protein